MRANWPSTVAEIGTPQLIFVDESGITTEMTRRYGRVMGGHRLNDSTPASWLTLTILGAVGLRGGQAMDAQRAADYLAGLQQPVERQESEHAAA